MARPSSALKRILQPILDRIRLLASRGVVDRVDDSTRAQEIQARLLANEVRPRLERMGGYGFSSVPEPGAELLVVFPGGDRAHGVVVATEDRRYRPRSLAAGEVVVYHRSGSRILLKADGSIELQPSNGQVKVDADLEVTGALIDDTGGGNLTTVATMRTIYNAHTHVETGGTTAPPSPPPM